MIGIGYLNYNGYINVAKTEQEHIDIINDKDLEISSIRTLPPLRNQRYNIHPLMVKADSSLDLLAKNTNDRYLSESSWNI